MKLRLIFILLTCFQLLGESFAQNKKLRQTWEKTAFLIGDQVEFKLRVKVVEIHLLNGLFLLIRWLMDWK